MWSRKCGDCKKGKRIEYETVFRGIRICSSMEELEQFVEEIHEKALVLGYHPRNEAFCIERAIRKKEKDYIAFDVCVPVEE